MFSRELEYIIENGREPPKIFFYKEAIINL